MHNPVFTGACVAIVTPFTDDNKVDFDQFGQLIERQIAAGTDAICVCGTTGESATMSLEEHMETVEYCIKKVAGRVKVIAGAGSNDTAAALMLSQHAEAAGADALLLVTPYYNKATQMGLIKHYEYIADRVHTPIILYNVPSRTGCSFTAATYQQLAKHPNICGVKEASGNFGLMPRDPQAVRRRFLHLVRQRRSGRAHDEPGHQGRDLRSEQRSARGHGQDEPPLPGGQL